jgi:hypothetical protein
VIKWHSDAVSTYVKAEVAQWALIVIAAGVTTD